MTRQEQNKIIRKVWTEHLKRQDDIPTVIADGYSIWLRQVIKQAAQLLNVGTMSEKIKDPAEGGETPEAGEPGQPANAAAENRPEQQDGGNE